MLILRRITFMEKLLWLSRLEENKRQRKHRRRLLLGITACTVLLGTCLWYFFVYIRTPEYALHALQTAITEKNRSTFEHYADLKRISDRAYDDLTVDFFAYDKTLTPQTRKLFENFYVLIKPQVVEGTEETILRRIETGDWSLPAGNSLLKGRQLGIDYERILERSQIRDAELVRIGSITRNDHTAMAQLIVKDMSTQTPFTLLLSMEQTTDGHWQVVAIDNYRAWLDAVTPLIYQDIASYIATTQPIVNTYNQQFQKQQQKFHRLTQTKNGQFSAEQRNRIASFLENEVLSTLEKRQQALDAITIPAGAAYLASMRKNSTEKTTEAWQHFINAIRENKQAEFDTAESLHKQELEIDSRIGAILRRTARAQTLPEVQ